MLDFFDSLYKTNTGGNLSINDFHVNSENKKFGLNYLATSPSVLVKSIEYLNLIDLSNFTFIDLGSGKGRSLIVANHVGFKTIIGVEFAKELADISIENMKLLGLENVEIFNIDASTFKFTQRSILLYMFNPFSKEVMSKVIENIKSSLFDDLYIIYNNPQCAYLFDESGCFTFLGNVPDLVEDEVKIWHFNSADVV